MSVHLVAVIPTDPRWVPDAEHEAAALAVFGDILGDDRRTLEVRRPGRVEFHDAGEYFEGARCPACGSDVDEGWWRTAITDSWTDEGFVPPDVVMRCCAATTSLNDIVSDPPEGFASWSLLAVDPDRGELDDELAARIETALGHPIRVVLTRY